MTEQNGFQIRILHWGIDERKDKQKGCFLYAIKFNNHPMLQIEMHYHLVYNVFVFSIKRYTLSLAM